MVAEKSKRNYCLDFIKGIACICVVFMHCEFPGVLGIVIQCVSRFCVPFFFMVSGYFAYKENVKVTRPSGKKVCHILKITAMASAFYAVVEILKHFLTGSYFAVSKSSVVYWILFNQPFIIAGQLWFLFALLYVYIMYALIQRFGLYKIAYCSIPILLVGYIVLAQGMHLAGKSIPNMVYRNFLFEGFPLFMLGHFLHCKEDKILAHCRNNVMLILTALFTLLCLAERYFMGRDFGVNIFTFPQVSCMFILGMKNPARFESHILRRIGTKLSMFVYIIHPFVWHTLEDAYSALKIDENTAALYLIPILVLIITMGISVALVSVLKMFKKKQVGDKNDRLKNSDLG